MREKVGLIRQVDKLGRVVIPVEIRKELGINYKDFMEVSIVKVSANNSKYKVLELRKVNEKND